MLDSSSKRENLDEKTLINHFSQRGDLLTVQHLLNT